LGWDYPHIYDCQKYPLSSPMLSKLKKPKISQHKGILYVCGVEIPYRYKLHTRLGPEQLRQHLNNKIIFFKGLDPKIVSSIQYKGYFSNFGINEKELLKSFLRPEQFLTSAHFLSSIIKNYRLTIMD